ncbi:MAG: ribonuclease P protein component [Actinomycetaceae bacterium]|nr:ribonuclease P protein component [Actinomycetaceae bacterium]
MIARQWRMKLPHDFRQVFRHGAYARKEYLGVHYCRRNDAEDHGLVGFVVPKKALHLAVSRNRVKRQLRHIVARAIDTQKVRPSDYFVVRVYSDARNVSSSDLESLFYSAFYSAQAKFDKSLFKATRSRL